MSNSSVPPNATQPPGNAYNYSDLTQVPGVVETFVVLYIVVILLALFGNLLVIWTVYRDKNMHTVTNIFLVNLSVTDLLVAIFVMPLKLLELTSPMEWNIMVSDTLCSVSLYAMPSLVFASMLTLVMLTVERYYAIVHPLKAQSIAKLSRTVKFVIAIWLTAFIVPIPFLIRGIRSFLVFHSDYGSISRIVCNNDFSDEFRAGFFISLFLLLYAIPLVVMVFTSARMSSVLLNPGGEGHVVLTRQNTMQRREEPKKKVAKMVLVVAAAFILSWTPFYLVNIITTAQKLINGTSFLEKSHFFFCMLLIHFLGFFNSCVNPLIYTIMSKRFRRSFKEIFSRVFARCCIGKVGSSSPMTTTPISKNISTISGINTANEASTSSTSGSRYVKKNRSLTGSPDFKDYKKRLRKISRTSNHSLSDISVNPKNLLRKLSSKKSVTSLPPGTPNLTREELDNWKGSLNCLLDIRLADDIAPTDEMDGALANARLSLANPNGESLLERENKRTDSGNFSESSEGNNKDAEMIWDGILEAPLGGTSHVLQDASCQTDSDDKNQQKSSAKDQNTDDKDHSASNNENRIVPKQIYSRHLNNPVHEDISRDSQAINTNNAYNGEVDASVAKEEDSQEDSTSYKISPSVNVLINTEKHVPSNKMPKKQTAKVSPQPVPNIDEGKKPDYRDNGPVVHVPNIDGEDRRRPALKVIRHKAYTKVNPSGIPVVKSQTNSLDKREVNGKLERKLPPRNPYGFITDDEMELAYTLRMLTPRDYEKRRMKQNESEGLMETPGVPNTNYLMPLNIDPLCFSSEDDTISLRQGYDENNQNGIKPQSRSLGNLKDFENGVPTKMLQNGHVQHPKTPPRRQLPPKPITKNSTASVPRETPNVTINLIVPGLGLQPIQYADYGSHARPRMPSHNKRFHGKQNRKISIESSAKESDNEEVADILSQAEPSRDPLTNITKSSLSETAEVHSTSFRPFVSPRKGPKVRRRNSSFATRHRSSANQESAPSVSLETLQIDTDVPYLTSSSSSRMSVIPDVVEELPNQSNMSFLGLGQQSSLAQRKITPVLQEAAEILQKLAANHNELTNTRNILAARSKVQFQPVASSMEGWGESELDTTDV